MRLCRRIARCFEGAARLEPRPPFFPMKLLSAVIMTMILASPGARAQTLAAAAPAETPEQHNARMQWWREARFGLFIHWGIYSVPAGTYKDQQIKHIGEWIMLDAKIPVVEYAAYAKQFNPVKFDADAWVRLAKEAGMKYIVITSKHHDGFAMFKSDASSYNIVDATPFKRDPIAELAVACQKYGLKLGLYYSQAQDWHHAGGAARRGHWDPAQEGSMDDYLRTIAVPQVREILTNYGPIAVLWWDTPENMTSERAAPLAELLKLQPNIITNNRLGGGYMGDTETPEQRIPATGYPRDWESCMTMNDTWGYKSWDHNWKSSEQLLRNLIDIASKGGNYLLNVGPSAEGEIPQPSVERLHEIGAWLGRYGEAIYGTTASPFKGLTWGRATQKPDKLYLHVFYWPKDGKLTVPMRSGANKAYLLGSPDAKVSFKASPQGLQLQLPANAPDAIASVVVLEGVGTVDALPPPPIQQSADGVLELTGDSADLFGKGLRVEGNTQLNLTGWKTTDAYPQWSAQIDRAGTYEVSMRYAVPADAAGSEYVLSVGGQKLTGTTESTGGDFKDVSVGTIAVDKTGPVTITLKADAIAGTELMKLRALTLTPVGSR
jgi:alpha-L-fucosidase